MQILFKKPVHVCVCTCVSLQRKRFAEEEGETVNVLYFSLSLSLADLDGCSTRGTLQLHRTRKASLMGSRIGTGYFIYLQKYRLPVARSRSVFPTGAGRVRFFSNSRVSFPRPSLNIHSCRSQRPFTSLLFLSTIEIFHVDRVGPRLGPIPFSVFRSRIPYGINILSVSLRFAIGDFQVYHVCAVYALLISVSKTV